MAEPKRELGWSAVDHPQHVLGILVADHGDPGGCGLDCGQVIDGLDG